MSKLCSRCGKAPQLKTKVWCQPCSNEYERERWAGRTVEQKRSKWLKHKYNLTWKDYIEMYENQKGLCKLCDIPISISKEDNSREVACVDHCHTSGDIRGLLCNHCNRALGLIKDSAKVAERMVKYLGKHHN